MENNLKIPFSFPRRSEFKSEGIRVMAADLGGTKTNIALFKADPGGVELLREGTYHSSSFPGFIDIVRTFIQEHQIEAPDRLCVGVAGPVENGKVYLTNLKQHVDAMEISQTLKLGEVTLLNDLEATAYGLAALTPEDILPLVTGRGAWSGNMAILAPGTGLGEAGLYWDGTFYHPFPTEGGHCDFSPRSKIDIELMQFLQKKYQVVSWEHLLSGPGIHDTYLFLREISGKPEPDWLLSALDKEDPSAVISQAGLEEKDPVCIQTMQFFTRYLARESANLVLKLKATGGLFLGGGIPPKIIPFLKSDQFLPNYFSTDRMNDLLEGAPVYIITKEKTALYGAAYYGAFGAK